MYNNKNSNLNKYKLKVNDFITFASNTRTATRAPHRRGQARRRARGDTRHAPRSRRPADKRPTDSHHTQIFIKINASHQYDGNASVLYQYLRLMSRPRVGSGSR
ncbi:hypothetical protein O3G_MSEX015283 [Manduca sexta]|uniref:Uncharacterized protein n=1 Tax=Manduca sexta TaxID=7130 RepID=A0A922D199_MANSE|nr:hypothetical protein O3G_MSEX015283 [Manduca sexta]